MKKILIISLAYFPHVGGAEIAVKEITDRQSDIEWHMVTKRFGGEPPFEKIGNVVVNRIGDRGTGAVSKFFFQFYAALKAQELHRRHEYDAVWAVMAHSSGVPAALFKIFNPKVPLILTLQEGDPIAHIEKTMRPLWPLFVRAFTSADVVQAISSFLGKWARTRGFSGPLEIIPNGVAVSKFEGNKIPHEGVMLITTSRLVTKNAVDDIIRALPHIPDASLQVLGTGPEEANLKKLAARLGVESRVDFLGYISQEKIPEYLHKADVFIRPSRSEGMGNSFIEAMAAGLPVVATQEGGIADFLFDAKLNPDKAATGWAVRKDSPEQIAQAVQTILSNPEAVRLVVERARVMVRENYDWDLVAKKMRERVFNKVLNQG
jgi:glycosyltransferase involved in cell wall biosynthesis